MNQKAQQYSKYPKLQAVLTYLPQRDSFNTKKPKMKNEMEILQQGRPNIFAKSAVSIISGLMPPF